MSEDMGLEEERELDDPTVYSALRPFPEMREGTAIDKILKSKKPRRPWRGKWRRTWKP